MSRILISLLLFITVILQSNAQNPAILSDKIVFTESQQFAQKTAFTESRNQSKTDFVYQRMEWNVDPGIRYISGKITTYFKSKTSNLTQIEFDLSQALEIDSITSKYKTLDFSRLADKIQVTLQTTLLENQLDSLSIYYKGIPLQTGFGAFTTSTHGTEETPVLWTLSEPYGALEWWPCKQTLSDKIDSIDIIVTTPDTYRTASNGILVAEHVKNEKRTMHWKHRFPIATYLIAIAVTNYESYANFLELEDGRKIEILNYVYPENLEDTKTKTAVTANCIQLYNTLVGEYPFATEKYGHAQIGWGGGMEHQTMSFMGNFSFGLIAHELAHQWFGDCITLGSWQHIWLNEGFATYLTGLAHENLENKWWPVWKDVYKNKVVSGTDGSVFVTDTTSISRLFDSRLSYAKGAFLLHMQRWILGDEIFFAALNNYFSDEKVAHGFAQSKDWIEHIEAAGDTTLTEFFDDWLYGEGYPTYSIDYSQNSPENLTLALTQNTSHPSVSFFEMPIPIRVYGNNKTDSTDFRLKNTTNFQQFVLNPGFMVDKIVVDPDNWILCKTDKITSTETIPTKNKIIVYPNPTTNKVFVSVSNNNPIIKIQLYSIDGNLIEQQTAYKNGIDMSYLPAGTYLIQIETHNTLFKKKVVKY